MEVTQDERIDLAPDLDQRREQLAPQIGGD
jgi:hypothetical protein